ncbi:hypothetical protein D3C78_1750390 [compost metagenome]
MMTGKSLHGHCVTRSLRHVLPMIDMRLGHLVEGDIGGAVAHNGARSTQLAVRLHVVFKSCLGQVMLPGKVCTTRVPLFVTRHRLPIQ